MSLPEHRNGERMSTTMTETQKAKYDRAIGDGSDWPYLTDDPVVNWHVDQVADEECPYDQTLYEEEIAAARKAGLPLLTDDGFETPRSDLTAIRRTTNSPRENDAS